MRKIQTLSIVSIVCLAVSSINPVAGIREVSHEDIRDAILSLVHMFRDNTDKLERHEYRERQLGDQLKKTFTNIEKKQKSDEGNLNTILDVLSSISKRLGVVESLITAKSDNSETVTKITRMEELLLLKLTSLEQTLQNNQITVDVAKLAIEQKMEKVASSILQLQSPLALIEQKLLLPTSTESPDSGYINVIDKVDSKLSEIQPELRELKMLVTNLNTQRNTIDETKNMTKDILEQLQDSAKSDHIEKVLNSTLERLQELKSDVLLNHETGVVKLHDKISTTHELLSQEQENTLKAVSNSLTTAETLYTNVEKNYQLLLKEIKGLSKLDQVLIQTGDNVLDLKRRVEYGTHQILLEVGDLILQQANDMNATINKRFDNISETILINQKGALTNLSTKIETEISQVWRQIGIMYQTLTNSADALDRLQQQTEIYVNGSLSTMDSMEGKVGQITGRMSEVDDNLNYLLGRLSLVTQEFNQIKTGLGEALDNIRSSFHTVQSKVQDSGPGPNPIEDDIPLNDLEKSQYTTV